VTVHGSERRCGFGLRKWANERGAAHWTGRPDTVAPVPQAPGELFADDALAWEDGRRARRYGRLPRDARPYDWAVDLQRPVQAVPYDWSADVVDPPPRPREPERRPPRPRERRRREPQVLQSATRPRREPTKAPLEAPRRRDTRQDVERVRPRPARRPATQPRRGARARPTPRVELRRRARAVPRLVIVVAALATVAVIAQAAFRDRPTTTAPDTSARAAARQEAVRAVAARSANARAALAGAKNELAPQPASYVATAERGVYAAARAGRLPAVAVARARQALALAANALPHMPPAQAAALTTVLGHVAAQAREYDSPRALALFGMLETNARYLSGHALPVDKLDIQGPAGVVYRYRPGEGFQFHPIANFAKLNALVTERDATGAAQLARAIVARGIHQRDALIWEYYFPFQGYVGWTSGFAQAVGAQALARTSVLVHDRRLLTAAHTAFVAIPARFAHKLGGGMWVREYSFSDTPILNSQLQTLLSVSEYARIAHDPAARVFADQLAVASKALLPRFSTGCWSLYSLGGHPASLDYHRYHLVLLKKLAATRPEPLWADMARRWQSPC
jgi:D-glucuronyl C5-epimerase-like protein